MTMLITALLLLVAVLVGRNIWFRKELKNAAVLIQYHNEKVNTLYNEIDSARNELSSLRKVMYDKKKEYENNLDRMNNDTSYSMYRQNTEKWCADAIQGILSTVSGTNNGKLVYRVYRGEAAGKTPSQWYTTHYNDAIYYATRRGDDAVIWEAVFELDPADYKGYLFEEVASAP